MIDCIIALELARASTDVSVEKLVTDVISSIRPDIADEASLTRLQTWLRDVLGIDPLMISAKGISVMQDNERTFLQSRVITDIRPVYKEGLADTPKEPPSAAVIVHNLKLGYREAGEYKEFFITLDGEDLNVLRRALERADAKTSTLSGLLTSAKVNQLKTKPPFADP
jgi:hypothetical protein